MRQRGFSLFELLGVLLVVAVALAAGVPSLRWLIQDARRTADINMLVTAIQLARSESAKRSLPVIVCKTADYRVCGGSSVHYEQGFMVFVDEDNDNPPGVDDDELLLFAYQPRIIGTIRSNRAAYTFRPYFRRSTNGTITFCDQRGAGAARAVIVSYTGRPRVSDQGPGGRSLVCAG
jgi:type IV fimbrial biogenesis protein FimT